MATHSQLRIALNPDDGSWSLMMDGRGLLADCRLLIGGRSDFWKQVAESDDVLSSVVEEKLILVQPHPREVSADSVRFTLGGKLNLLLRLDADRDEARVSLEVEADDIDIEEVRLASGKLGIAKGMVLANGFHSWDPRKLRKLEDLGADEAIESFGCSVVDGELLFGFTGNHVGMNKLVHYRDGRFEAVSRFGLKRFGKIPREELTLVIEFGSSANELLARFAGSCEAPMSKPVGSGWCSWYYYYHDVSEKEVVKNAEVMAKLFKPLGAEYVQLDDGYQRANGDWDTNDKFPHGHRWLTDRIHELGMKAGLWIAPFIIAGKSPVFKEHPEWMIQDEAGKPKEHVSFKPWGGQCYVLDPSHPGARNWLRDLARMITDDWGYDYIKIDFLHYVTDQRRFYANATPVEAYLEGLRAIREGAGEKTFILGCGAPIMPSVGLVDGIRIGGDVWATWGGFEPAVYSSSTRWFMNGRLFWTDPDVLLARPPLTIEEARTWASFYAFTGQMNLLSDNLPELDEARLALLQKSFPVRVPEWVEPVITPVPKPRQSPVVVADDGSSFELSGRWVFKAGDGDYASPTLDESDWTEVRLPHKWDKDLDGFGWYRASFVVPRDFAEKALTLELGKVDDADETFFNGTRIGKTGELPPDYEEAWSLFRRYAIPKDIVRPGEVNTLAIRAYDGGGAGGLYELEPRLHAFEVWRCEDALLMMNLDERERTFAYDLDDEFIAFDFWERELLGRLSKLQVTLKPHACAVIWLRPVEDEPCILGSSAHILGTVDWKRDGNELVGKLPASGYIEPPEVYIYVPASFRITSATGSIQRVGELCILTLPAGVCDFRLSLSG